MNQILTNLTRCSAQLDKTNPGLSENLWSYATHTGGKVSSHWSNNFIGGVVSENQTGTYDWGYNLDESGRTYYPIYIGYEEDPIEGESEELSREKPYILMIYGCDNSSYFLRAKDVKRLNKLIDEIGKSKSIHDFLDTKDSYWYNS